MTVRRLLLGLAVVAGAAATMGSAATHATPAATTGSASSVTGTSATLNGTVDPAGAATTWQFEIGTSTGYGTRAPATAQSAGSGTASVAAKTAVSGLQPGTTYHFRLTATNASGTTVGRDATFTTTSAPVVRTGGASSVSTTSAKVACSVNPKGESTAWAVEYGQSTTYGTRTSGQSAGSGNSASNVSATLTGLQSGKTYHYRCVATSSAGTTAGADASFTTAGAPSAVTGASTDVQTTSATVAGTVNPNGTATQWWVEYGTSTSYGSRTNAQSAGSGTSAIGVGLTLVSLTPGATYHYRVVAQSSLGTAHGADASFTTVGPPAVVTGTVPFPSIAPGKATVTGTVNPRSLATTVWFEYGRTTAFTQKTGTLDLPAGTSDTPIQVSLSGLTPGARYYFRIVASSSAGTSQGATRSFSTPTTRTAAGRACTIVGTQGADVLRGTSHRDVICGLGGNDRIYGMGGNDVLIGGPGDDILDGGSGDDVIQGGLGTDRLLGGAGYDQISGGAGSDFISARDHRHDVVVGGPGRDTATLDRADSAISIERRRY